MQGLLRRNQWRTEIDDLDFAILSEQDKHPSSAHQSKKPSGKSGPQT